MGFNIIFPEDVANALQAADEAASSTARYGVYGGDPVSLWAYLEGYRAALITVALAFGLSPAIVTHRKEILNVLETLEIYGIIG